MFFPGLRTNIIITIAAILAAAMILIDCVMLVAAQKDLLRFEVEKHDLFVSLIKSRLFNSKIDNSDFNQFIQKIFEQSNICLVLILDKSNNPIYFITNKNAPVDKVRSLVKKSIKEKTRKTGLQGTSWGVLSKIDKYLVLAIPIFYNNNISGGIGIVIELEETYRLLRKNQFLFFIYFFINLVLLAFVGSYRIIKLIEYPLNRLVKRAKEYQEDELTFFLYGDEENSFNKLSKALNNMLQRIAGDRKRLQLAICSLEKANKDLKEAQHEIIRAEKLASIGRLSSGIAHEIGNPIGIIIGYLDLLKQPDISNDDKEEFIQRAYDEVTRIDIIIRQLLDLSRPFQQGLQSAVAVHDIVEDTVKVLCNQPLMADISLKLSLQAISDNVRADPQQLRQIFLNLAINASDALKSCKHITKFLIIKSENISKAECDLQDGLYDLVLKISFIDNGPGISNQDLKNIFDPFFTTKRPGKGTGLGLYVCFMIVKNLGGTIKAESKHGKWTSISLYLPVYIDK